MGKHVRKGQKSVNKHHRKGKYPKFGKKSKKSFSLGKIRNDLKDNKHRYANNNDDSRKHNLAKPESKKRKYDDKSDDLPPPSRREESSDSEDENEDPMKQLLHTFGSDLTQKRLEAIESGSEDEEDVADGSVSDGVSDEENLLDEDDEVAPDEEDADESVSESELSVEEDEEIEHGVDDADNTEQPSDPFINHIQYDMGTKLLESVQSVPTHRTTHSVNWPMLGNMLVQIPNGDETQRAATKLLIPDEKVYAKPGTVPSRNHLNRITLADLHIKSQIGVNVKCSNKVCSDAEYLFTPLQNELFSVINNYQDLYYGERTFDNAEEIRFVYTLHAVNHIIKTRTRVVHHNAKLTKKDDVPDEFRDQGLVRPKVLIIAPFRDSALKIVRIIIDLLVPDDKGHVLNKNRFLDDFTGQELIMPRRNPKPEDYELTFSGNTNDDFKIGLTVTKKSIKLYTNFYSSDIIIASPLGLRQTIGAEGEADRNYDFLASIELLIMDQTELFVMQNWDHVLHALNHLHLQPKESHGTDFSRVRSWSLNGWSKYYRQTLLFASFCLPEFNSVFNKRCFNYAGSVKVVNPIENGTISQVVVQQPHVFQKFEANSLLEAIDARLNYFVGKILSQYKDSLMKQTLIYIPNYFDYVRLRNYFKREDIGFVQICEYTKDAKVARARDMFFHGDAHFLLYTERYHFFNRIRVKGFRHLIFYQPPTCPTFYSEMCNLMQEGNMNKKCGNVSNMTVTVLYTKYDVQQVTAIVGTKRAAKMLQSEQNVHMFVTDGQQNAI